MIPEWPGFTQHDFLKPDIWCFYPSPFPVRLLVLVVQFIFLLSSSLLGIYVYTYRKGCAGDGTCFGIPGLMKDKADAPCGLACHMRREATHLLAVFHCLPAAGVLPLIQIVPPISSMSSHHDPESMKAYVSHCTRLQGTMFLCHPPAFAQKIQQADFLLVGHGCLPCQPFYLMSAVHHTAPPPPAVFLACAILSTSWRFPGWGGWFKFPPPLPTRPILHQ